MTESKRMIVVVDDDIEIHDMISAYFKPRGFEVTCYDKVIQALKDSATLGHSWDVLLTDYHFVEMSSEDFTKEITTILPLLPVILITPDEFTDTALQAIEQGAFDFISRPIHFAKLQVSIDRALKVKSLNVANSELRKLVNSSTVKSSDLIGRSPKFLTAVDIAKRVSKSMASILVTGESGTGKEVFAKFIHSHSERSLGPFVAINCSSIPENLLESELFGHAKGSFTGALEKRIGLFEAADNGTLFLDEIGDLSLPLQAKLLRVLQEKKIKRVGENREREINCRIISATHKNLATEIQENRFREDLYFRLNVIPITIPALRDRPEDILILAGLFLRKFTQTNDSDVKSFSKDAIKFLLQNKWQGNVRELENAVERAVVLCKGKEIAMDDFIPSSSLEHINFAPDIQMSVQSFDANSFHFPIQDHLPLLDDVINKYIVFAINKNGGARDRAAKEIGIDRKTLYRRIQSVRSEINI